MANDVNKVIYGNTTVMDISDTTAQAADVASGEVFYTASGARTVGTGSFDSAVWGNITGDIDDQTDLQGELAKKVITLTKAQYDALSTAEKNDPTKVYYVTDYEPVSVAEIDDTVAALNKVWSGSKTSSEIEKAYKSEDAEETDIQNNDYFPYFDTSATGKRKTLWSNIKAKLKSYFDTVYVIKDQKQQYINDRFNFIPYIYELNAGNNNTMIATRTGAAYHWMVMLGPVANSASICVIFFTPTGSSKYDPSSRIASIVLSNDGKTATIKFVSAYSAGIIFSSASWSISYNNS